MLGNLDAREGRILGIKKEGQKRGMMSSPPTMYEVLYFLIGQKCSNTKELKMQWGKALNKFLNQLFISIILSK